MPNNKNPREEDIIVAIKLSQKAERRALDLYTNFYTSKSNIIPSSEYIIPKEAFIKILNDCMVLSQQKIEDRPILTKFIFPNIRKEFLEWPKGANYTPIKETSLPSLNSSNLKKYIEIASGPNTFLVIELIKTSKENNNNFSFMLKGFLFVEKSLNNLIFKIKQKSLKANQVISGELKRLYNSVIFSINDKKINASYFNRTFLTIQKGMISSPPDLLLEAELIITYSTRLNEKLQDISKKGWIDSSLNKIFETFLDIIDLKKGFRMALIQYRLVQSLANIIIKISEARHGSTLIFGFNGEPKDEDLFQPGAIELKIPFGSRFLRLENPNYRPEPKDQDRINSIESYENAIVSLSKTDGAMIFDLNLDLVLAGTFLKTKSSASLSGGARRKSAEGFITDNHGTIAIVISQDGSITYLPEIEIN